MIALSSSDTLGENTQPFKDAISIHTFIYINHNSRVDINPLSFLSPPSSMIFSELVLCRQTRPTIQNDSCLVLRRVDLTSPNGAPVSYH